MDEIKVSVLVPIFNVEKYIDQCLASLKKQEVSGLEIICIDDGSTDKSGLIADKFAEEDERFRVIHKLNTGYGDSMNIGMDAAKGEYIAVLEGDDFASKDMVNRLYCTAKEHNADIVKSNYYEYKGDDESIIKMNILRGFPRDIVFSPEDVPEIMLTRHCVWNAIYKKKYLEENNIRFLNTPGASYQDVGFLCKCWYTVSRLVCVEDYLVYYRTDNPSQSIKSERKVFCVCDEYKGVRKYIREHPLCEKRAALALPESMFKDYENTFYRVDMPFQYGFLIKFKEDMEQIDKEGYLEGESLLTKEHRDRIEEMLCDVEAYYNKHSRYNSYLAVRENEENLRTASRLYALIEKILADYIYDILKNASNICIFGAGKIGIEAKKMLENFGLRDRIRCFLVSNINENNTAIDGISVFQVDQTDENSKKYVVLVAVKWTDQLEAVNILEKNQYKYIINYTGSIRKK